MDWTTIYEETGGEEFQLPSNVTHRHTRITRLVSAVYQHHHHHHRRRSRSESHAEQLQQQASIFTEEEEEEDEEDGYASHRLFLLSKTSSCDEEEDDDDDASTQRSTSSSVMSYSSYSLSALYCLSINYILGVGCLGVPYAFARAGFMLCGIIILVVSVTSYVTVMWVAECGVRLEKELVEKKKQRLCCQSLNQRQQQQQQRLDMKEEKKNGSGNAVDVLAIPSEQAPLLHTNQHFEVEGPSPATKNDKQTEQEDEEEDEIDPNSYEVIDLVRHYLGNTHSALYQLSLMSLMYIGLLAYSQVFCNATSALILPDKHDNSSEEQNDTLNFWRRIIPQLVFGSIVVPLSCAELNEQVSVQAIMAVVRFVAIFIMVGGSVVALFIQPYHAVVNDNDTYHHHPPYFASEKMNGDDGGGGCEMSYTACFDGFGVAFSTALFSQLFQHSVPGLLRPLEGRTEQIKKVPLVFGLSLITTCTFYLILGMSAASYFGAETKSSVNLNFANFTFGLDPNTTPKFFLSLCKIASSVVVMFPALDTLSVFPLIANTLGSNLLAASGPGFVRWIARELPLWKRMTRFFRMSWWHSSNTSYDDDNSTTNATKEEKRKSVVLASRIATVFWRLVAAFPPLLGSIWATDLSFSLLLAGVAGVYVAFFAPSLMQLASCRREHSLFQQMQATTTSTTAKMETTRIENNDSSGGDDDYEKNEEASSFLINVYSGWYSPTILTYPVLVFATFALGVVLVQIRDAWVAMRSAI